jgi:hypothetical protein
VPRKTGERNRCVSRATLNPTWGAITTRILGHRLPKVALCLRARPMRHDARDVSAGPSHALGARRRKRRSLVTKAIEILPPLGSPSLRGAHKPAQREVRARQAHNEGPVFMKFHGQIV